MGQKTIRFSDLTGTTVDDDENLVRIVVEQHPALDDGQAVELEALTEELAGVEDHSLELVTLVLHYPGESEPARLILDAKQFDALATSTPMAEVLRSAKRIRPSLPQGRPAAAERVRLDYTTLEHAGKPHKGVTSDAERKVVQENFDEVNRRLVAAGIRKIDLGNTEHVSRYGLEALAAERGTGVAPVG